MDSQTENLKKLRKQAENIASVDAIFTTLLLIVPAMIFSLIFMITFGGNQTQAREWREGLVTNNLLSSIFSVYEWKQILQTPLIICWMTLFVSLCVWSIMMATNSMLLAACQPNFNSREGIALIRLWLYVSYMFLALKVVLLLVTLFYNKKNTLFILISASLIIQSSIIRRVLQFYLAAKKVLDNPNSVVVVARRRTNGPSTSSPRAITNNIIIVQESDDNDVRPQENDDKDLPPKYEDLFQV